MVKRGKATPSIGTRAMFSMGGRRRSVPVIDPHSDDDGADGGIAQRVLRVLAAFAHGPVRPTVEDIASLTGFPRSSTYRYISILKEAGFIADDRSGRLEVTPLSVGFARASQQGNSLVAVARPLMRKLTEGSRELTLLAKRSGHFGVCIEICESLMPVRYTFELGTMLPLHEKRALRRTLLAFAPERLQDRIVAQAMRLDPKYRPRIPLLKRELQAIRARGYAESEAEITPDLWGVAAPVFCNSMTDTVLVMLAPGYRISRTERARLRSTVRTAAQEISERITYLTM